MRKELAINEDKQNTSDPKKLKDCMLHKRQFEYFGNLSTEDWNDGVLDRLKNGELYRIEYIIVGAFPTGYGVRPTRQMNR